MFEQYKIYVYIIGSLAVIALLGFIVYKIDDYGYQRGIAELNQFKLEITEKSQEETDRQEEANKISKVKEAELIQNYEKQIEELKKKQEESEREAEQDPTANSPALPPSSVLRINKVR